MYAEILGLIAGFFTTIAYAPQAIRAYRTKSMKDVSMMWLLIAGFGTTLWILYGIVISSVPIIFWNAGCDVLIAILIALKLKYS